ncbi:hypothetical protein JXR01_03710 [Candidatus Kaiserbacteria bacterium]|nr:MAG: hypothetical protein JXR01_03710 [Candidatus Kaiserbacteria bacterium]
MYYLKKYPLAFALLGLFVFANILFYFASPQDIVSYIGTENSYLVAFLFAATGGLSAITGSALYGLLATFAAGGANPWLLGLTGGLGIFISDSIFFYLARKGRDIIPPQWSVWVLRIENVVQQCPKWLVLVLMYLYISFLPFPNDVLMIALVLGGYTYRTIVPVLFVGSITIALVASFFGTLWF